MKDLFKAELLRFRFWALAALAVHLLVLGFLARVVDLAQQPILVYRVFGGVYVAAGLLLGLYQMASYRKPSMWLQLLHRPLAPRRIAISLLGAGMFWLAMAVAVPILLVALYQATLTARVVDLRHWLLPVAAVLIAGCGYLAGAVAMLGNRRWSTCGLVLLVLPVVAQASGWAALAVQALVLAWLACLIGVVFKPDLGEPPRGIAGTALTALTVQMGAYVLILLLGFGIEMVWIMQGSHPNNTATPPHGGHNEVERTDGRTRMLAALSSSPNPQAPLWRGQIELSKVYAMGADVPWRLSRNALTNHVPMEFEDARRRIDWVFSDDRMRFEGHSLADGRTTGELGAGSKHAPFPAPALAAGTLPTLAEGDTALIAGNTLYHYVSETGQALPRVRLPQKELLIGATPVGESLALTSDRALYVVDGRALAANDDLVQPRLRLPIPGQEGDLRNVDVIELVDGYLVSFLFSANAHDLNGVAPYQSTWWLRDDGSAVEAAHRPLRFDYPAVYRYKAWWPSPAMYALREASTNLFAAPDPPEATSPVPTPRSMVVLADGLMLLSLLLALVLVRRRALARPSKIGWTIACGVIGVPALVSLWLLYPDAGDGASTAAAP